jgi:hypothetical protein
MLQPVRAGVPEGLGDRPADAALQLHQQPADHLTGVPAGLAAREAIRCPPGQFS